MVKELSPGEAALFAVILSMQSRARHRASFEIAKTEDVTETSDDNAVGYTDEGNDEEEGIVYRSDYKTSIAGYA